MLSAPTLQSLSQVDPDRLRAAKLAAPAEREALEVLYAFHYELAKIPELVSEPMIGAIRYQWWRDCVDEIYTGRPVRKHEISTPLALLLTERDVPRFWVDALIDGRERDLDPRPFSNIDEAESYAQQTSGQLLQIASHMLAPNEGDAGLGTVWGLTGLVRGFKHYEDGMLSQVSLADLRARAAAQYAEHRGKVSPARMPAAAYVSLTPIFLKAFADPETARPPSPLRKQARLMSAALRGKL